MLLVWQHQKLWMDLSDHMSFLDSVEENISTTAQNKRLCNTVVTSLLGWHGASLRHHQHQLESGSGLFIAELGNLPRNDVPAATCRRGPELFIHWAVPGHRGPAITRSGLVMTSYVVLGWLVVGSQDEAGNNRTQLKIRFVNKSVCWVDGFMTILWWLWLLSYWLSNIILRCKYLLWPGCYRAGSANV